MDLIQVLQIDKLGSYAHAHVKVISYAMATSIVVMTSGPINNFISEHASRWHFLVRTLFYITLFTVGYASFAYWTEHGLRQFLSDQKGIPLVLITIGAFLGFGLWTSKRKNVK